MWDSVLECVRSLAVRDSGLRVERLGCEQDLDMQTFAPHIRLSPYCSSTCPGAVFMNIYKGCSPYLHPCVCVSLCLCTVGASPTHLDSIASLTESLSKLRPLEFQTIDDFGTQLLA